MYNFGIINSWRAQAYNFTYDANGNTITENTRQYIYNQKQRLIAVTDGGVTKGQYVYNANGQRVIKTVGSEVVFLYDLSGQLIAETSNNGSALAEYIYLNGQPMAKIDSTGVNYIQTDHLGTPAMMTNANGAQTWDIETKPFGDVPNITGPGNLNIRFLGQYYDQETGLHYNYFRDYKPETGRYIEADPIGIRQGSNHLYLYAGNNSINRKDRRGLTYSGIYGDWDVSELLGDEFYAEGEISRIEAEWNGMIRQFECLARCYLDLAEDEARDYVRNKLIEKGVVAVLKKKGKQAAIQFVKAGLKTEGWITLPYTGYTAIKCFVKCGCTIK